MGYYVTALAPTGQQIARMQVGGNGAMDALLPVLLAGYSLTDAVDAVRVRGRWYTWRPDMRSKVPGEQLPIFDHLWTKRGARAGLAFGYDGTSWLTLRRDTIARGRRLQRPRCPHLTALLDWYDANETAWETGNWAYPAEKVGALADALTLVLPQVQTSPWAPNAAEFAGVVRAAAEFGGTLDFG